MRRLRPLVFAAALSWSAPAGAYTIESVATEGCHERITAEALRRVRSELAVAPPIEPTEDEQAMLDDLQFSVDDDMGDLGAVALLFGVRDNDLKGQGSDDLTSLAFVHGDPDRQREHCLRSEDDDEPDGTTHAVAACRAFIEEKVKLALWALSEAGVPDPDNRTSLAVHLAIRGDVELDLPAFYVYMGQALHALEDSFSHAYRTQDAERITASLNWIDVVGGTFDEARDGPAHSAELDRCDDADDLRRERREVATEAARALLRAALDPTSTIDQRMTSVRAVLDRYVEVEQGCTEANRFCDAREASYDTSTCACSTPGRAKGSWTKEALAVLAAMALGARRARRRGRPLALCAIAGALAFGERSAWAQTPAPEVHPEPGPPRPDSIAWGAALTAAGAVDKPALAGALGGRVRLHRHFSLGLDAEWNPFISVTGGEPVRSGVVNVYATGIVRFPLAYEPINLRSSYSVGSSTLVTDLYGAPSGTTGIFAQARFLGLEYKASRLFYLVVEPLGLALPVPQLKGVPFLYPQYRLALSIEVYGS